MDFENCPGKMKEYGISIARNRDVELVKDELEEQIVHLLPQEQINFGFMNGYGGILHKYLYDINVLIVISTLTLQKSYTKRFEYKAISLLAEL